MPQIHSLIYTLTYRTDSYMGNESFTYKAVREIIRDLSS